MEEGSKRRGRTVDNLSTTANQPSNASCAYGFLRNKKSLPETTTLISHHSNKPTGHQYLVFAGRTHGRNCAQRACTRAWSATASCSQSWEFRVQNVAPIRVAESPESQGARQHFKFLRHLDRSIWLFEVATA